MLKSALSVIIPAYRRVGQLRRSLQRIRQCVPPPAEVLVHIDESSPEILDLLNEEFPDVRHYVSRKPLGPGGSRDRMIREARHEWVANFDDDSHPVDPDYFARVAAAINAFPNTAVFSATTVHEEAPLLGVPVAMQTRPMPVFSGCGCVYRKSWYLRTRGYVPLPVAYGMEEVDISLQLHALGGKILEVPQLRVFHHDPYAIVPSDEVLAYSIANIALFGFLRFPVLLWPLIPLQLLSRIGWAVRRGWTGGMSRGLAIIPRHLARYRKHRAPVSVATVLSWLQLRHQTESKTPNSPPS